MKIRNCLKTIPAVAAIAIGLSSCDHKDLCYTHPHTAPITVEFDWRNNLGVIPEAMAVYAYPQDGGEVLRFDVNGRDGGQVTLPLGDYDFVCVNPTSQRINFRGTEIINTFEACTPLSNPLEHLGNTSTNGAPRAEGTEDEEVRMAPDDLWHSISRDHSFTDPKKAYRVVLTPEDQLCNYTYEIRNVENLQYVQSACATISGMGGSLFVNHGTLGENPVTVPVAATSDGVSTITGSFRTFGHCPVDAQHKMVVYTVLGDGSAYYSQIDVTAQVHNAPDKRNVHIVVDGLSLPKPITSDNSGFKPTVSEWEEIFIELEM